jgi:hypothetical protein
MIGQNKERWRELCEQVAVEQDPKKLVELATEIYRLLEEKRRRLQREALNKTLNKKFPTLPDDANGCRLPHI